MNLNDLLNAFWEQELSSEQIEAYLNSGGNPNQTGEQGVTLLLCATEALVPEWITLLLEKGANINQADANGWTPLHTSVDASIEAGIMLGQTVDMTCVKLLIEAGADETLVNQTGQNPREVAACYGQGMLDAYNALSKTTPARPLSLKDFAQTLATLFSSRGYQVESLSNESLRLSKVSKTDTGKSPHLDLHAGGFYHLRDHADLARQAMSLVKKSFKQLA